MTKTNTFGEHLQRAIPETCDLWDIWSDWWGDMTWPKKETMIKTNTKTETMTKTNTFREHLQRDPRDLWDLRHWLQFWQLRTWFHDNLCYQTIKSDTGQHSQFLRCLLLTRLPLALVPLAGSLQPPNVSTSSHHCWIQLWDKPLIFQDCLSLFSILLNVLLSVCPYCKEQTKKVARLPKIKGLLFSYSFHTSF